MSDLNQSESIVDKLNQFFKAAVSPEAENHHFPWNSILQYLKIHEKDVLAVRYAPVFGDFFIKLLETRASDNAAVSSAIIDIITVLTLENDNRELLERLNAGDAYEYFFRSKREDDFALGMFYLSKKRRGNVFPGRENIQVVNALKTGNHRLMQVLATYGYNVKISGNSFFARKVATIMIRNFMSILDYNIVWSRPLLSKTYCHTGFSDFLQIAKMDSSEAVEANRPNVQPYLDSYDLVYLGDDPLWRPKSVSFERLFLLTLGIHALWLKLKNDPELTNFLKCLDIYFKTIGEPYLAVSEVRSLFIKYFTRFRKEHLLDEWCKVFSETMPFCSRNHEPRRLCHLARCQVRENLCKSGNTLLPAILNQMEMPKQMKEFLLCKPSEGKAEYFL